MCVKNEGKCVTWLDGYYIETVICAIIGFAWLSWGSKKIRQIQSLDDNVWKISKRTR